MRVRKTIKNFLRLLAGVMLIAICFPSPGLARTKIDTDAKNDLTIKYECGNTEFRIYYIAAVSAKGEYTLDGDFKDYAVSTEQSDQSGWRALASALSGYASRDKIAPVQKGKTDAARKLAFSDLPAGLYLVIGDRSKSGGYSYEPTPFLISLPALNSSDNWEYSVEVSPKYDRTKAPSGGGGKNSLKVIKIWKDSGMESKRPENIEVQLIRNGEVRDTVTLNEKCNWRHTWENLDDGYTWQVVEKNVPDGYTVTVQKEGRTIAVTNTVVEEEPDGPGKPDTPDKPDDPDTPNIPNEPDESSEPNTTDKTDEQPSLPQTGALWWPVGVLLTSGLIMLLLGCIRRRT